MKTVLFLGVGNSIRTQMAEAILRHKAGDRFRIFSAGLVPQEVHPMTLRVLDEIGIDISLLKPKGLHSFLGRTTVDTAIILSQPQEPDSPSIYPFAVRVLQWPFENPSVIKGDEGETLDAFRRVRNRIDNKIRNWLETEILSKPVYPAFPDSRTIVSPDLRHQDQCAVKTRLQDGRRQCPVGPGPGDGSVIGQPFETSRPF